MHSKVLIEVCLDSIESVFAATEGGAERVELCANLLEGGTTPSPGMIERAREVCDAGLQVMIRPRGGDFLYSAEEFIVMQRDIAHAKALGADGVVFGLLQPDGKVDQKRTAQLLELARPLNITFHRAFDMARDAFEALDVLIELGVDRILTSGQEPNVLEGLDLITRLIERAGDNIIVMPGCGITPRNVQRIVDACNPKEIHVVGNAIVDSDMRYRNPNCSMGTELRSPEYSRCVTSAEIIRSFKG